jgi:hypothetical protein
MEDEMTQPDRLPDTVSVVTATAWIDESLASHGIRRQTSLEVFRARPWATVSRIETDKGTMWFKAAAPATAFEARLYPLLHRLSPDIVLEPIAIDENRGWMLLPHGGDALDTGIDVERLVSRMVSVVPRYAEMQRRLTPYVPELLAIGVPDIRLSQLPARFDEVLAYSREFVGRTGDEEDRALLRRVELLRPAVVEWAGAAEEAVGGVSLDHSDLHARNILLPAGEGPDSAVVYDWGDSIVAHPFTSLLVLLRDLMNTLQAPVNDHRIQRVIHAYLESFTDIAPRELLVSTAMAVCQVGKITRAHAWLRAVSAYPAEVDKENAGAPLGWLGELLSSNLLDIG